jgi:serine/threonine protein kinase
LFFHLSNEVRFSVNRTKFYAAELVLAIGHLHSMQIIYRDLKPENVVLDGDGHAVMTDFGLAKKEVTDETPTQTFCGTPEVS